ncbi:MAG TPA: DUF6308 family protein [Streptosporangiaceae bacterium]|nr:DUF6308 family protein [Streptosporangiaceae bacterium]
MRYTDYHRRDDDLVESVKARLRANLETPHLPKLVAAYFDPDEPFAGRDFDHLGSNLANRVTIDDLLAASLLDVKWSPLAVRKLLGELRGQLSNYLANIGRETDLWDASDHELRAADDLWFTLIGLMGVKKAKASKLMARKRPRLAPISDEVVVKAIGARGRTWPVLRHCLQDESFRGTVLTLRGPGSEDASVLRLLDVALWMLHSRSKAAGQARHDAGVIRPPEN